MDMERVVIELIHWTHLFDNRGDPLKSDYVDVVKDSGTLDDPYKLF